MNVNNNKKIIVKKLLGNVQNSDLSFCDLSNSNVSVYFKSVHTNFYNFQAGIPVIIVKKKNGYNQSSTYYAIRIDTNPAEILAQGIGKEEFYNELQNLKQNKNTVSLLAIKILIFFKIDWYNNPPPFSKDFYNLNEYFMNKTQ